MKNKIAAFLGLSLLSASSLAQVVTTSVTINLQGTVYLAYVDALQINLEGANVSVGSGLLLTPAALGGLTNSAVNSVDLETDADIGNSLTPGINHNLTRSILVENTWSVWGNVLATETVDLDIALTSAVITGASDTIDITGANLHYAGAKQFNSVSWEVGATALPATFGDVAGTGGIILDLDLDDGTGAPVTAGSYAGGEYTLTMTIQ